MHPMPIHEWQKVVDGYCTSMYHIDVPFSFLYNQDTKLLKKSRVQRGHARDHDQGTKGMEKR